jgi:hypothetical protein
MPHRRLARRVAGINWLRWELGTVVAFHGCIGLLILLAPRHFVVTPATWPIFYYLGRSGMGAAFLVTAAVATACWLRPRPAVQLATWLLVYMLGAGWVAGFVLAVRHGSGGLYGLIIWAVLLTTWISTAVRLGLGDGGASVERRSGRGGH